MTKKQGTNNCSIWTSRKLPRLNRSIMTQCYRRDIIDRFNPETLVPGKCSNYFCPARYSSSKPHRCLFMDIKNDSSISFSKNTFITPFKEKLAPLFRLLIFLLCYSLTSCEQHPLPVTGNWQTICCRDDGSKGGGRFLLYRALVPNHWIRKDPDQNVSIKDTTQPICEFYITKNDDYLRLTIHTFPFANDIQRIPPQAQVTRWKKQFDELDLLRTTVHSVAHGGFYGLYFEGNGLLNGRLTQVMGWAMQLANVYVRQLSSRQTLHSTATLADYTIKATGSPDLMMQFLSEIMSFGNSFELIDELPLPL